MSDELAITVENLSKVYKLYSSPVDRLKESLHPLRRQYHHDFYALNDVSFEIKKGESVGIIGKNGSGKSTLLKILTGVLTPTSGSVTVNGKVSALLELGAGFNPDLTGIENVYFNGMLMGYTREEMEGLLDGILSFADIGEFVQQPVKTYSSGMFVRLAFAVAVNVDPEILIIDEALAVGDLKFQKKCKQKMSDFRDKGITQLIVSHNMSDITTGCSKALYLKNGILEYCGEAVETVSAFLVQEDTVSAENMKLNKVDSGGTGDLAVNNVDCFQIGKQKGCTQIEYSENIIVEISYNVFEPIDKPLLRVNFSAEGYQFFVNFDFKLAEYDRPQLCGSGIIRMEVIAPNIYPGSYTVNVAFLAEDLNTHLFYWANANSFTIYSSRTSYMVSRRSLIHLESRLLVVD